MSIGDTLHQIAQVDWKGVVITPDAKGSYLVHQITLKERIIQLFSHFAHFFGSNVRQRNQANALHSCHFFERTFGEKRFYRAAKNAKIDLDAIKKSGAFFTKQDIRALFVQLGLVTKQDLEEMLKIKQEQGGFLDKQRLEDCTNEQIDFLVATLLPFHSADDLLCRNESLKERLVLPLNRSQMHWQVVRSCEAMRRKTLSVDEWEVYFAKKLSPPQYPQGLVVRHPEGYLYYDNAIESKGVSKLIYRPVAVDGPATHVMYRGTRGPMPTDTIRETVDTIVEDFTSELGAPGIMDSYEETKKAFAQEENLHLVGFSLGGAQAQRDALLFSEKVARITTVNSPGIDLKTALLFAERIKQSPKKEPMQIVHNADPDDAVDAMGECHLGVSCDKKEAAVSIRTYIPQNEKWRDSKVKSMNYTFRYGVLSIIFALVSSLRAHVRPTTMLKHTCQVVSNAEGDIQGQLSHHNVNKKWESTRRLFSRQHAKSFSDFAVSVLKKI